MQIMQAGGHMSALLSGQLVPICVWAIMAVSLNLTVGVLGELSLGHAGFMSIGAFTGAIACIALESAIPPSGLRLAVSIFIGASFAGLAGFIIGIPVLRLEGDYLAIVTLAFGEIIKSILTCLYVGLDGTGLHFGFLSSIQALGMDEDARTVIEGPMGVSGIARLSTLTSGFVLLLITLLIVLNLVNSRSGRAIMALRDNRIAAESVGIPVFRYKLMAFITSATLAGAAGVIYAMNYSSINASKFNFSQSILVLVFVVFGGLGNMWGSILAAGVLTILPEALRQFSEYRMLVYSIILILVMLATHNAALKELTRKALLRISSALKRTSPQDPPKGNNRT